MKRPILMLSHSYYEEDSRVRREAGAVVESGRPVDVIALQKPDTAARERIDGVEVHRLPVVRQQGAGVATYAGEYLAFFWRAGLLAARLHRRRHYALVQVHSLPDWLIMAGLPMRLADGVPLLLDLHEAMPEFFRTRFPGVAGGPVFAALHLAERLSIGLADGVLTVNEALADRLVALGVPARKVTVVVNSADTELFTPARYPDRPFMADGALRLVYAGAVTPLYDLETVLDAVTLLASGADAGSGAASLDVRLDVFGRGDALDALVARATERGVEPRVSFHGRVPLEEVPARIAAADAGLAPNRRVAYTQLTLSTKLFEYAAMDKPILAARLPNAERYFGATALAYYEPADALSLAAAVRRLTAMDPTTRAAQVAAARDAVERNSWSRQRERYLAVVERLAGDTRRASR